MDSRRKKAPIFSAIIANNLDFILENSAGYHLNKIKWEGYSPLMVALYYGRSRIARHFLALGADVFYRVNGLGAMECAAAGGKIGLLELLNAIGLSYHGRGDSDNEWPPIFWAAQEGRFECFKFLFEQGAILHQMQDDGTSVLSISIGENRWKMVDFILNNGADPNLMCVGTYPLHLACRWSDIRVVRSLVQHGANPDLIDREGLTAWKYALDRGRLDFIKTMRGSL